MYNVASWLVARFAYVAKIVQIILNPCNGGMFHYYSKNSSQTILFVKMCVCEKKLDTFLEKYCLSAFPKRIKSLIKPLLKNCFSTKFQGTAPWEGPVLFSRFVA